MKPSIEKMLQKPYDETLADIETNIGKAITRKEKKGNNRFKTRAYILKTIL